MPLDVPTTMAVEMAMHVGRPKLRRPTSEKARPVIFCSLVHRTTSHGPFGASTSESGAEEKVWLAKEEWRECWWIK